MKFERLGGSKLALTLSSVNSVKTPLMVQWNSMAQRASDASMVYIIVTNSFVCKLWLNILPLLRVLHTEESSYNWWIVKFAKRVDMCSTGKSLWSYQNRRQDVASDAPVKALDFLLVTDGVSFTIWLALLKESVSLFLCPWACTVTWPVLRRSSYHQWALAGSLLLGVIWTIRMWSANPPLKCKRHIACADFWIFQKWYHCPFI